MKLISLLFREKKYIPFIVCIIVLLIVQAYCELMLPHYTSAIVDVGIMQGGVEDAVPNEIRQSSMDELQLFMTAAERESVDAAYSQGADGQLALDAAVKNDAAQRAELAGIFQIPEVIITQMNAMAQAGGASASGMPAGSADTGSSDMASGGAMGMMAGGAEGATTGSATDSSAGSGTAAIKPDAELTALIGKIMSGQGTDDDVVAIQDKINGEMTAAGLGTQMLSAPAVEYVRAEYQAINLDMGSIQMGYMKSTALVMLTFALVSCAAAVIVSLFASLTSAGTGRRLRREAFAQIMSFSNTEMDKFSSASLITRSTNDIQQIQMATVFFLRMVLYAPAMAVGGIIMVTRTDTGLAWVIVAAILILGAVIGILLGLTMPKFQRMQGLIDGVNLVGREILTGLFVIRAFNREDFEKKRFDGASTALYKNQLFTNRAMSMFMPIVFFIMNIIMVGIVWFGGKSIDAGGMQVGGLMAFMSYTMYIVMAFMMFSMVTIMLPRASVAAGRVLEVINTKSSIIDKPATELRHESQAFTGSVAFEDVSFRYHDADEDTLTHISFTAEPGKTTAIIGGTGCGKSTLVGLLPRLFDVTRGRITIDGVDIRDLSQKKLRSLIGLVPQKAVLFAGTVESNIKYADADIPDEAMRKAAEIAQAAGFVDERDGGYESEISQSGSNVSGGQRQRLAIARAIAKDPKIFIFDDSFSALDYRTDANLRKALAKNVGGATILIVAQRIATILRADKIIVLEEGKVVGEGTHQELLESCPVYRDIAASQLSETELSA